MDFDRSEERVGVCGFQCTIASVKIGGWSRSFISCSCINGPAVGQQRRRRRASPGRGRVRRRGAGNSTATKAADQQQGACGCIFDLFAPLERTIAQTALARIRESIQLDPSLPWTETLSVTYPDTITVDVDNDLERELALCVQALDIFPHTDPPPPPPATNKPWRAPKPPTRSQPSTPSRSPAPQTSSPKWSSPTRTWSASASASSTRPQASSAQRTSASSVRAKSLASRSRSRSSRSARGARKRWRTGSRVSNGVSVASSPWCSLYVH